MALLLALLLAASCSRGSGGGAGPRSHEAILNDMVETAASLATRVEKMKTNEDVNRHAGELNALANRLGALSVEASRLPGPPPRFEQGQKARARATMKRLHEALGKLDPGARRTVEDLIGRHVARSVETPRGKGG